MKLLKETWRNYVLPVISLELLKGVPVRAMKAYGGCGSMDALILDLGTRWTWAGSFTLWPLYPSGKKARYTCNRRAQNRHGLDTAYFPCWESKSDPSAVPTRSLVTVLLELSRLALLALKVVLSFMILLVCQITRWRGPWNLMTTTGFYLQIHCHPWHSLGSRVTSGELYWLHVIRVQSRVWYNTHSKNMHFLSTVFLHWTLHLPASSAEVKIVWPCTCATSNYRSA